MADTVFQQIRSAIDTRLKTILVANGYNTDAGSHVFYWRTALLSPDSELPGIIYLDTGESTENSEFALQTNKASVIVKCFACGSDDATIKAALDQIYADVMKAIGVDETWGGLAISTEKISHAIEMERKEQVVGSFSIEFQITYRHKRWDVYTET
jgi:hypothetical protein